jgi:hypothetical protein
MSTTTNTKADAPYWMGPEDRFRFWEQNGISDHDCSKQIAIALANYTDVPEWQLPDAKERFVDWCNWFSDFCYRVNYRQDFSKEPSNA